MNVFIGIDFSMNSTGLCIHKDKNYKFANFPRNIKIDKEPWKSIPIDIINNEYVKEFNTYQEGEINKLIDSNQLSILIINYIKENTSEDDNLIIGLEGISFSSKGSSTIDIAGYQWILRSTIKKELNKDTYIFAPQTIKKFAGNGRYKKEDMLNKFLSFTDEQVCNTEFWKWTKKEFEEKGKMKKPCDDIIDSFWIVETLKKFINI